MRPSYNKRMGWTENEFAQVLKASRVKKSFDPELKPNTPYRMEKARQRAESPLAQRIEKLAGDRLASQRKRLLARLARSLAKAESDPISDKELFDDLADSAFPDALDGVYRKAVNEGGDLQAAQLKIGWREEDPDVQKFIKTRRSNLERVMDDATAKEVKRALAQGRLKNETEKELIDRLEGLGIFGKARAQRIARTEAHLAVMTGAHEAAKQSGVTHKSWLAGLDERTRPAHLEANGQTVKIDEPFIVDDEELDYPGDPEGSAGNIINCRCTNTYHRVDDEDTDLSEDLEIDFEEGEEDDDLEDSIRQAVRDLPKGQTIGVSPKDLDSLGVKRIKGRGASYDPDEGVAHIGPSAPKGQIQNVIRQHIVASSVTASDASGFTNQLRAAGLAEPSTGTLRQKAVQGLSAVLAGDRSAYETLAGVKLADDEWARLQAVGAHFLMSPGTPGKPPKLREKR